MKKFLKYFIGIIVLLIILFIVKGLMTPSISYSSEITVDKPVKEAWAVMKDESKISEWLKGITKKEHIKGEKGAVGAVTNFTFSKDGQETIIQETIKSISPYEHIAMDFMMKDVMEMDYRMDFSEEGGKTHIKSSTTAKGIGFFMKSMMSFMEGTMKKQEDENLNNLKKVIDSNKTDYFPAPVIDTTNSNEAE